jgi:hypothetical protein
MHRLTPDGLARNPAVRLATSAYLHWRLRRSLTAVDRPFTARASYRLDRAIVALERFESVSATARGTI